MEEHEELDQGHLGSIDFRIDSLEKEIAILKKLRVDYECLYPNLNQNPNPNFNPDSNLKNFLIERPYFIQALQKLILQFGAMEIECVRVKEIISMEEIHNGHTNKLVLVMGNNLVLIYHNPDNGLSVVLSPETRAIDFSFAHKHFCFVSDTDNFADIGKILKDVDDDEIYQYPAQYYFELDKTTNIMIRNIYNSMVLQLIKMQEFSDMDFKLLEM